MRHRALRLLALVGVTLVLVGLTGAPGQALVAGSAPTAVVSPNPAVQDAVVEVRGNGWRALSMVTAVICGNEALDGSKDCDLEGATVTQVFEDGTFMLRLLVRLPPSPCPCLIRITDIDSTTTYDLPLRIANAPIAEPRSSSPAINGVPALTVVSARVEEERSLASLFGAPAPRVLLLQVRNDSAGTVTAPLVTAGWGRDGPDNTITSPEVDAIASGEERQIRVPFELSALAFGDYQVDGALAAYGLSSPFETSTTQWPWGLVIVMVVLVQLLVLWILRRNRRIRLEREAALAGPADPAPSDDEPAGAASDLPAPEEPVLVAAGSSAASIGDPAGDGETATEPTIPPRDIRLEGPVTAAPWH